MRTTINIEDALMEKVMALVGTRVKTEAVGTALREFVRFKTKEELLSLRGKLALSDNWRKLREREEEEKIR